MAGCEFELLLDGCCIVVSLCLSSEGNRCGSFSFVAFESQVLAMLSLAERAQLVPGVGYRRMLGVGYRRM